MSTRFLIPAFLIIATIAFLVSLGLWQLDRADQKRTIEAAIVNAKTGPVELIANGRELLDKEYYDVRLQGNYLSDKQFIYDNQIVDQVSGYYVLTPFILTDQLGVILVNRGFIPWNGQRERLADIAVDSVSREIKVQVSSPIKRMELKATDVSRQFPVLIQAIDFDVLEEVSKLKFVKVVGLLDPSSSDGYVRKWEPYTGSIEKHIGYAIQWFLMALVLAIIGLRIGLKRRKK
ncbi:MAG: SURF1 family protein [Candidatus Pseudothioglobus sp.]